MKKDLSIILDQCEKQADKLLKIKVDDAFMAELDVFDSYFSQLQQIMDEKKAKENSERLKNLRLLIERFKKKVENAMEATMKEIKNAGIKKRSIGYGTQKASEAIKFDKRL